MYILIDMSVYIYIYIYIYVIMLILSVSLGNKRTQQKFPKSKPPDLQVERREGMMMINRANPFNSSCTRTNLPECLAPQDLNRSRHPRTCKDPMFHLLRVCPVQQPRAASGYGQPRPRQPTSFAACPHAVKSLLGKPEGK